MNRLYIILFALSIVLVTACEKDGPSGEVPRPAGPVWLVDTNLLTGTRITERFPLVTRPVFVEVDEAPPRSPEELAVVFIINETVFVFPHWALGMEVVNGEADGVHFAVTYCPKTQTTYVVNRQQGNQLLTLRASGILYQNNLVYYDLETGSLWSQLYYKCIHGHFAGQQPRLLPSFETTYALALATFRGAKVFTGRDAVNGNIKQQATGNLPQNGDMVMGLPEFRTKQENLAVINLSSLDGNGLLITGGHLMVYDKSKHYLRVFKSPGGPRFYPLGSFPVILYDSEGNRWDVFGRAVDGPWQGQQLEEPVSFLAYWWAWKGIYDGFSHLN